MGSLFGGKTKTTTVQNPTAFETLPPEAQALFRRSLEAIEPLATPEAFMPADLTPDQLAALETLRGQAQPLSAETLGETTDLFFNPYQEQVLEPAFEDIRQQTQQIIGDIGSGASAAGGFGGTRQGLLEQQAVEGAQREIGRLGAQTRGAAFDTATQRALGELSRQGQAATGLFNVGEGLRQLEFERQRAPLSAQEYLLQAALGTPAGGGTYNVAQTQQAGLGQTLGGLGGFLAGAGALFSDRILKEDIKFVRREGDHNIYEFKYKGQDELYEGVMADEVLKINPEAVIERDGYFAVDYEKIEPEMRRIN